MRERTKYCRDLINGLFMEGIFPNVWKIAKLVLIPKPGHEEVTRTAYRTICLLDTFAKLYESIILKRLDEEMEKWRDLKRKTILVQERGVYGRCE